MDPNKFNQIMGHAASLMTEDFDRRVDGYARQHGGGGSRGGGAGEFADLEAQALGYTTSGGGTMNERYSPKAMSGTMDMSNINNLPEYMREEFRKNPPAVTESMEMPPASYYGASQPQYQPQPQRQPMREQYTPQAQQGGVDYNYIKYLIENTIKESMRNLNESTNMGDFRGMRITGKTIQFIDNKGNVYEGTLSLKKKAQ